MTRYITPTGWAEEGRRRDREPKIEHLGGTAALIERLPAGAYIVVENAARRSVVEAMLPTFGRAPDSLRFILATTGYHALDIPADVLLGVDEGALNGVPAGDRNFVSILRSRFPGALWA